MSKLTVAELIGETPEMMRACGEVIKYEDLAHHYNDMAYRFPQWEDAASYCRSMHESAMADVARLVAAKRGPLSDILNGERAFAVNA